MLFLCCLAVKVIAQEFPKNGVSLHVSYAIEVPLALSYERYIDTGRVLWGLGAGITLVPSSYILSGVAIGPHISTSIILGRANHHFEAKAAVSLFFDKSPFGKSLPLFPFPMINIGYRFQNPGLPLFFRATVGFPSGIGLAVGYAF